MFRVTVQSGFYWVPKMTRSFYKYFSSGYIFLSSREKEYITRRAEFSKSLYIHLYLLKYILYFFYSLGYFDNLHNLIRHWYEKYNCNTYTFKHYNIYDKFWKSQLVEKKKVIFYDNYCFHCLKWGKQWLEIKSHNWKLSHHPFLVEKEIWENDRSLND